MKIHSFKTKRPYHRLFCNGQRKEQKMSAIYTKSFFVQYLLETRSKLSLFLIFNPIATCDNIACTPGLDAVQIISVAEKCHEVE